MAVYQYCFLDSKGKKKTAHIEASSLSDAKEKLRLQKLSVLQLSEAVQKKLLFKKNRCVLKKENLSAFTTQLAQLLKAGLPLYESLLSLEEQYRSESFHPIILSLCEKIKNGSSLSSAMGQFPQSFAGLYVAMVAAGESVGALDQTLDKLAQLLIKQDKLKKMLMTSLLYPAILFFFSLAVIFSLLIFVIPSLQTLFEDRDVNGFTKAVMGFSHFLTHQWMFYIPLLIGALCSGIFLYTSPKWNRRLQKKLLHVPFLKTVLIHTAVARFTRTMGTLLQGGVSIISAMQIAKKVMRHPTLEEIIDEAEAKIIEGSLLSQELKKSKLIPSFVPRMLAIGEEGGNASIMLHKVADFYEEEIEKTLSRLTQLLQPVVLIIMGGVVGLIMLAVLLPLTDVSSFT